MRQPGSVSSERSKNKQSEPSGHSSYKNVSLFHFIIGIFDTETSKRKRARPCEKEKAQNKSQEKDQSEADSSGN